MFVSTNPHDFTVGAAIRHQDVKLNRALWTLAEEKRKLKAAH
jgi:hypothetical protein